MQIGPILAVLVIAVLAPLIAQATRKFGMSLVVLELLLGFAAGPHGLDWARPEGGVPYIAIAGMAFLFFLAGMEIDLQDIRGQPLKRAFFGWAGIVLLACLVAFSLRAAGLIDAWQVVAIALTTTALGVVMPILKDAGQMDSSFGRHVLAAGAVGELGPILMMSLLLSTTYDTTVQTAFMFAFIALVLISGWLLLRGRDTPAILKLLRRTMTQTNQLPVRLTVLLIAAFVVLAEVLGLDLALGALTAGMIVRLATRGADTQVLHQKLNALGFGFLVPVFFIASGMKLDLGAVFAGSGLWLALLFFCALLALRLAPFLAVRDVLPKRHAAALTLYSATTLPLVVALSEIGIARGLLLPSEAAPLVGGAMLGVILFPPLAMRLSDVAKNTRRTQDWEGF